MRKIKFFTVLFAALLVSGGVWGVTGISQPGELKTALNTGGEYQLKADITTSEALTVNGLTTLDLNGHSLTYSTQTGYLITVSSNQTLTLSGAGTISGNRVFKITDNTSTLVLNPSSSQEMKISATTKMLLNMSNGTFTDNGAYFNTLPYSGAPTGEGGYNIVGGWYTKRVAETNECKIGEQKYETIDMAINVAQNGDEIVLLKDKSYSSTNKLSVTGKKIILNLKTFTLQTDNAMMAVLAGTNAEITIKGEEGSVIKAKGEANALKANSGAKIIVSQDFLGKVDGTLNVGGKGTLEIYSGYFKLDPTNFKATGCTVSSIKEGTYAGYHKVTPPTPNPICSVTPQGGSATNYTSLSEAVTAWKGSNGSTLTLLDDVTATNAIEADVTGSFILDLNGHTLTSADYYTVVAGSSYSLSPTTQLTINATNGGSITNTAASGKPAVSGTGGTLIINGGTISKFTAIDASAVVTINGGTFGDQSLSMGTYNIQGGTISSLYLYGGSVVPNVSISGGYVGSIDKTKGTLTLTGGEYGFNPSGYVDGLHYKTEVVTAGTRWRVVAGSAPASALVDYLRAESGYAASFLVSDDIDISDYGYPINAVGEKVVDLNGHNVVFAHNALTVAGTLTLSNSSNTQASFIEPNQEIAVGEGRTQGATITVTGALNVEGNIRIYGNADAIRVNSGAFSLNGAKVVSKYNGAIALVGNNVIASIQNADISSSSSSVLNGAEYYSFAIRANGGALTMIMENSTVIGVHGAVGVAGPNSSVTIKNCDLQSHNSAGKTDAFEALYVAENSIVNVWGTKMFGDRENGSAYIGNDDVTSEWGVINLYEGCYLKDKMQIQSAGESEYSFPSQIPPASVWYKITSAGGEGPLPEGHTYDASDIANYNWKVTSEATGASEIVATTDIYWDLKPTWSDESVPEATDLAFVPVGKDVIIRVPVGEETYTAVAQQLSIESGGSVTVKSGATLEIGTAGLNIATGGELYVEAQAVVTIENAGALTMNNDAVIIRANDQGSGCFLIAPAENTVYTSPEVTVEMFTNAGYRGGKYWWQHFGVPVMSNPVVTNDRGAGSNVQKWVNSGWEKLSSWDEVEPFRGYNITNNYEGSDGVTYTFKGNLVGNNNAPLKFLQKDYNLLANSYTAPLDLKTMFEKLSDDLGDKVEITAWVYQAQLGSYWWANKGEIESESAGQYTIAPMQGFILRLIDGETAEGAVDYEASVWENPNKTGIALQSPARKTASDISKARIVVSANGHSDLVKFYQKDNFTSEFENGYDASKYMNEHINLYVESKDENLATVASNDMDGLFLTLQADENVNYTLSFENVNNFDYAILDTQTGVETPIEEGKTYEFVVAPNSTTSERFQLVSTRNKPTTINQVAAKDAQKGVYTVLGQYVGETANFNTLPNGLYIVNGQRIVK